MAPFEIHRKINHGTQSRAVSLQAPSVLQFVWHMLHEYLPACFCSRSAQWISPELSWAGSANLKQHVCGATEQPWRYHTRCSGVRYP